MPPLPGATAKRPGSPDVMPTSPAGSSSRTCRSTSALPQVADGAPSCCPPQDRNGQGEPDVASDTGDPGTPDQDGRLEVPLTVREREVLGYLAELLTSEEIALAMSVSVATIRSDIRSIMHKLVARRNEVTIGCRNFRIIPPDTPGIAEP